MRVASARTLVVAMIAIAAIAVAPAPVGQAAIEETKLHTRDLVSVPISCDREVFITSLNNDDDNGNGTADKDETLPLRNRRRQPVQENNLREFVFNVPEAKRVYIAPTVVIPTNEDAVGTRVRAYESDRKTRFTFGERDVPVTMLLEGIKQSPVANDIGFEYQYFKEDGTTVCGSFAQGTVVRADGVFRVETGKGSPFSNQHKMLIGGTAQGRATVAPAGLVTPQWTYDAAGATFSASDQLTTDFTGSMTFTPAARIDQDELRLGLTGTATKPANQKIEAHEPVNLTAPRRVRLTEGEARRASDTGMMDADEGTFNLINTLYVYAIQDQTGVNIRRSAYAGRMPQARENIAAVLSSPIAPVQAWITANLEHSPDWVNMADGELRDRIRAIALNKNLIVVTENGRRRFEPSLRREGGVVMSLGRATHIWQLSVNGNEIVDATNNTFSATVQKIEDKAQKINVRATYEAVTP